MRKPPRLCFKIDIKSETQAREIEGWLDIDEDEEYEGYEEYDEYENYEEYEDYGQYEEPTEDYYEEPLPEEE